MYIAKPGLSLIEVVELESIKRFGPEVVKKILMTGGFFAMHVPKGGVMNMPLEVSQLVKPSELQCLTMLEGTSIIQVLDVYKDRLSEDDVEALLLHEEGHIRHGHEMPENVAGKETVNGILIDLQIELEADAYAASKVGKRRMAKALTHVIEVMAELASTKVGTQPRDEVKHQYALNGMIFNPQFRARIAALQ